MKRWVWLSLALFFHTGSGRADIMPQLVNDGDPCALKADGAPCLWNRNIPGECRPFEMAFSERYPRSRRCVIVDEHRREPREEFRENREQGLIVAGAALVALLGIVGSVLEARKSKPGVRPEDA